MPVKDVGLQAWRKLACIPAFLSSRDVEMNEMNPNSAVSADQLLGQLTEPPLKEWVSSVDVENTL